MTKITYVGKVIETTDFYNISGVEPIRQTYGTRLFRPVDLEVRYVNGRFASAVLSGPRVHVNGDETDQILRSYYWQVSDLPDWLQFSFGGAE